VPIATASTPFIDANIKRELRAAPEEGVMTAIATPTTGERRGRTASRRVIVVADNTCTTPELCASVRDFARETPIEAFVIAPAHGTAATQWYVDEDAARADATHRLRTCVNCLVRDGIRVSGELSVPDPIQAIADALHEFPADEILLVTAPQRPSRWLRQNVIDRARRAFLQPITHIVMPAASERSET
jgi:GABA permease